MVQFKGYTEINRVLKERIVASSDFELGGYVGENDSAPPVDGLTELLGFYRKDHDLDEGFRAGHPNSLSMVLWSSLLSRLGRDIGEVCAKSGQESPAFALTPRFRQALIPVCRWPQAGSASPVVLRPFWDALMGFDAPDSEYLAWQRFADEEVKAGRPAPQAIPRLVVAALLNPYFLLKD
jgi:hypothetical protein